jgi:erythromycin esterase-like protein
MINRKNISFKLIIILIISSCQLYADELDKHIQQRAIELKSSACLTPMVEAASGKKLVLLGEASHGTHEYYTWRDSISRRLITEAGFNFILVEGDFVSIYELNRYVKDLPGASSTAEEAMINLNRWPTWMWRNHEVLELIKWLRDYNSHLPAELKVGFYGMDVYDEWRSKEALLSFSLEYAPELHQAIADQLGCFTPYWGNSWNYARAVYNLEINCMDNTEEVLRMIIQYQESLDQTGDYDFFYLLQNAYVVNNAEKFYRKSISGRSAASWNSRVTHMFNTSLRLLDLYGKESKGIIWAHNTHIGDAMHTDMARYNQTNIGELTRQHFGDQRVMLIGFTTYRGNVMAGSSWGSIQQVMNVRPAQKNSLEERLNRTGIESFYLLFDEDDRNHRGFMRPIGNRAIGVVYNPQQDARQFVPSIVPMRYDAIVFISKTSALKPLNQKTK